MEVDVIKQKITEKYPGVYENEEAFTVLLEKIENMDLELKQNLEKFLATDELHDVNVEGYTVLKLQNEHSMNEVAAFLTLDWLKREPEAAKAHLKKGHDVVTH